MKKDIICNRMNPQCPECYEELIIVLHGLVMEKYLNELKEKNIPFYNAGCMCFGDDRDTSYYCGNCKKKFDDNLSEIVLITCPRVVDYKIRQEECENNELLELKYSLYDERFCTACKMILKNEDDEYRKATQILELPEEVTEKVIEKKNSNLKLKRNMDYKRYLCEEQELIRRLEYWD